LTDRQTYLKDMLLHDVRSCSFRASVFYLFCLVYTFRRFGKRSVD